MSTNEEDDDHFISAEEYEEYDEVSNDITTTPRTQMTSSTQETAINPLKFGISTKEVHEPLKGDLENLMGTVVCHSAISLFDHDEEKLELDLNKEGMYQKFYKKYIECFGYPEDKDNYKPYYANTYYGGMDFSDSKTTSIIRSTGWELIKEIGRKIISGDFNLTTVTIPIKVTVPISILQHICNSHINFPLYLNLAALTNDPLQRLKLVIVACFSSWYKSSVFLKPLNPILGETYEMIWEDGSHEYVEQTSHHPPISHFIIYGPNNHYRYYGYMCFTSNAWINSFRLTNTGKREIEFKDSSIEFNFGVDQYSNTFIGVLRHECVGEMKFKDTKVGISSRFKFGKVDQMSDYFEGSIEDAEGKVLSNFKGSYLSNITFDDVRYWDIRRNIDIEAYPVKKQLPSSSIYRDDSILLYERKLEEAQEAKNRLENLQRHDRKLRAKYKEDS